MSVCENGTGIETLDVIDRDGGCPLSAHAGVVLCFTSDGKHMVVDDTEGEVTSANLEIGPCDPFIARHVITLDSFDGVAGVAPKATYDVVVVAFREVRVRG